MATVDEVLAWRPTVLDQLVGEVLRDRTRLTDLDDDLAAGAPPPDWTGDDAEAARRSHQRLAHRLNDLTAEVGAVTRALSEAAAGAAAARRALEQTVDQARGEGFFVELTTGRVLDPAVPDPDPAIADDRERLRVELTDRIGEALRAADHTDGALAGLLGTVASKLIDGGTGTLRDASLVGSRAARRDILPIPVASDPGQVFGWWESLSSAERERLLAGCPGLIGNTDGIPMAVRDRANRAYLPMVEQHLREQYTTSSLATQPFERLDRGLPDPSMLRDKLDDLAAIRDVIASPNTALLSLGVHGRRFITADVAVGRVDRADHVTTTVSGVNTRPAASLKGKVDDARNLLEVSERMSQEAGDDDSHAVIVSMAYEAPQLDTDDVRISDLRGTGREFFRDNVAKEAAPGYADFLNSIDTTRLDDPHQTLAGHSYGSLTAGHTLRQGTGVDDFVALGSPGTGVDDVADLKVPRGHVHNLEAERDVIADLGVFGEDLTHLDGVRELDTAGHPGQGLDAVSGHTDYYADGSTSQHNIAAIGSGHPELAIDDTRGPDATDIFRKELGRYGDLLRTGWDEGVDLLRESSDTGVRLLRRLGVPLP